MKSKSILSSSKKSSSKKTSKRKVVTWHKARHTCPVCKGTGLLSGEHVEYLNQVLQLAKQGHLQEARDAAYAQLEFAEEMGLDVEQLAAELLENPDGSADSEEEGQGHDGER